MTDPIRKVYRVGDGETRFTETGERPLSAEEKYQPSMEEVVHQLGIGLNNLAVDIALAFNPLVEFVRSQEFIDAVEEISRLHPEVEARQTAKDILAQMQQPISTKDKARQRSRDDMARKRRELRQRKGRL